MVDDGRTPDHGHPISSPCEPDGSGELKISGLLHNSFAYQTHENKFKIRNRIVLYVHKVIILYLYTRGQND